MKKSLLLSTIVTLGLGLCSCHGTLVPSGGPIEEKPDYIFDKSEYTTVIAEMKNKAQKEISQKKE